MSRDYRIVGFAFRTGSELAGVLGNSGFQNEEGFFFFYEILTAILGLQGFFTDILCLELNVQVYKILMWKNGKCWGRRSIFSYIFPYQFSHFQLISHSYSKVFVERFPNSISLATIPPLQVFSKPWTHFSTLPVTIFFIWFFGFQKFLEVCS